MTAKVSKMLQIYLKLMCVKLGHLKWDNLCKLKSQRHIWDISQGVSSRGVYFTLIFFWLTLVEIFVWGLTPYSFKEILYVYSKGNKNDEIGTKIYTFSPKLKFPYQQFLIFLCFMNKFLKQRSN